MTAKLSAVLLTLALVACRDEPQSQAAAPEPVVMATATSVYTPPTPALTAVASAKTTASVMPESTPCGAEKMQDYLNLLPTATAKDEIARTLGHNRIRYVPLKQAKAEASPISSRLTGGIGADGRIKEFSCG